MFFRPWNNNIFVLQMMVNAFFKYADSLILYSNKSNEDLSYFSEIQKSNVFFFSWRDPFDFVVTDHLRKLWWRATPGKPLKNVF